MCFRINFMVLLLVFKCFNSFKPSFFYQTCFYPVSRSFGPLALEKPRWSSIHPCNYTRPLQKGLAGNVRNTFIWKWKKKVKTHLFTWAFTEPPLLNIILISLLLLGLLSLITVFNKKKKHNFFLVFHCLFILCSFIVIVFFLICSSVFFPLFPCCSYLGLCVVFLPLWRLSWGSQWSWKTRRLLGSRRFPGDGLRYPSCGCFLILIFYSTGYVCVYVCGPVCTIVEA